jgi:hypothetical protein
MAAGASGAGVTSSLVLQIDDLKEQAGGAGATSASPICGAATAAIVSTALEFTVELFAKRS